MTKMYLFFRLVANLRRPFEALQLFVQECQRHGLALIIALIIYYISRLCKLESIVDNLTKCDIAGKRRPPTQAFWHALTRARLVLHRKPNFGSVGGGILLPHVLD